MTGPRRIKAGSGHRYELDDTKVLGVTSVLNEAIPKPALTYWAAGAVANFVAERLDVDADTNHVGADRLVSALRLLGAKNRYNRWPKDDSISRLALAETLKATVWEDRDAGANRGHEVHTLAEHLVVGEEVDVPDTLIGYVDAYVAFLSDWDVKPILVEPVVINRTHQWMGTADLVADLVDGFRWLLDIKTGRSGIYPETALQLAAYRNAETYLDPDGEEQEFPKVDKVGAIWVRADGYDLIPVDAGPDTYRVFRHAQRIAQWQTETGKAAVGEAIRPPLRSVS